MLSVFNIVAYTNTGHVLEVTISLLRSILLFYLLEVGECLHHYGESQNTNSGTTKEEQGIPFCTLSLFYIISKNSGPL
jgi:hypothetical protein